MDDKIGMSLDEIHTSGNVPQCECFYGDTDIKLAHLLVI